ncbi:hypothetical protein D3C86_537320 [compost metagenome]
MLYLVNCDVCVHNYMDEDENYNTNHIVESENTDIAYDKIILHYDNKNAPYYKTYSVNINYVNELIT